MALRCGEASFRLSDRDGHSDRNETSLIKTFFRYRPRRFWGSEYAHERHTRWQHTWAHFATVVAVACIYVYEKTCIPLAKVLSNNPVSMSANWGLPSWAPADSLQMGCIRHHAISALVLLMMIKHRWPAGTKLNRSYSSDLPRLLKPLFIVTSAKSLRKSTKRTGGADTL